MKNGPCLFILIAVFFTSCGDYKATTNSKSSSSAISSASLVAISKQKLEDSEADVEQVTQELPTSPVSAQGWKLVFEDNFEGAQSAIAKGVDPSCFNRSPVCMINWWGSEECLEHKSNLADLNKCTWNVYKYYNYMDFEAAEGAGVNSFHPSMVKVKDGYLYLNAEKSFYTTKRCKQKFNDPRLGNLENYSMECPIISGGIESKKIDGKTPGYQQEFGRFEVRAKLNNGPGSWPAHWLLPQNTAENGCGWPYSGEIDIMESWANGSDSVSGTLHSGDCEKKIKLSKGFSWKAKEKFYPELTYSQRQETFYKDFHVYAAEWDKDKVRFLVDDNYIGQITMGDIIKNKNTPRGGLPDKIPSGPFYWILNTTIYSSTKEPLNTDNFTKQEHIIDYVKSYRKCTDADNPASCYQPSYKNTDALCPGIREYLGDFQGKSMCEAWPNFSISVAHCFGNDGVIDSQNKWCLQNEGTWYKARTLGEPCTWPRAHFGWNAGKPVCSAIPNFKIKKSNCTGDGGTIWNTYCIWGEDGWWRARDLRD